MTAEGRNSHEQADTGAVGTVAVFVVTGTYGTIDTYTAIPSAGVVDLLLVGLWIGAIWGYLFAGRRLAAWVWPEWTGTDVALRRLDADLFLRLWSSLSE